MTKYLVTVFDLERSSEPVWKGYMDSLDDIPLIFKLERLSLVKEFGLVVKLEPE